MYINREGVQFSYADTFNLDKVLSPIIISGLRRFKHVLEERNNKGECFGVPCEEGSMDGIEPNEWFEMIDKMIYAFEDNEPDTDDYGFKVDLRNFASIDNKEEWGRYVVDCTAHDNKVQEGLNLFAAWYKSLWW